MIRIYFAILALLFITGCNDIDDRILPALGTYEAHVVKVNGPFSLNISASGDDDIWIEAPFDGDVWSVVLADIDDVDESKWDIDIPRQTLGPGVEIWGNGFYFNGTLQLDYTMSFFGDQFDFRIIGSK